MVFVIAQEKDYLPAGNRDAWWASSIKSSTSASLNAGRCHPDTPVSMASLPTSSTPLIGLMPDAPGAPDGLLLNIPLGAGLGVGPGSMSTRSDMVTNFCRFACGLSGEPASDVPAAKGSPAGVCWDPACLFVGNPEASP